MKKKPNFMKNTPLAQRLAKQGALFFSLLLGLFMAACANIDLPDEEAKVSKAKAAPLQLSLLTAEAAEIRYPVHVLAFDTKGEKVSQTTVAHPDSAVTLRLPAGQYQIVALSGAEAYGFSADQATAESTLKISANDGTAATPLLRGAASLTMGKAAAKLKLPLRYAVSRVRLALHGLPNTVTAVSVQLTPAAAQQSMDGTLSGTQTAHLSLERKADGTWQSADRYLFPSALAPQLNISVVEGEQTTHYAYALAKALLPATPYVFEGSFVGGKDFQLSAELLSEGWRSEVREVFDFGDAKTTTPDHSKTPTDDPTAINEGAVPTFKVAHLPSLGETWQGHFVAFLTASDEHSCEAVLLSLQEWAAVPSALSDKAERAKQLAAQYVEDGLSAWHIPTTDEATLFLSLYGTMDDWLSLNERLEKLHAQALSVETGTNAAQYLCAEGESAFRLSSRKPAKVSATKTYRLRLFKRLRFERS